MRIIASAVATSEGARPNEPTRTTRTRSPVALTSVTIWPSRSAISSKPTSSSAAALSVSCTIAIVPTRRTASSRAAFASGASIRRACSRSSAATVCRLFFTRWWISRIVASLVTSSRSRRRRSVTSRTQHERADRLVQGPQRDGADDQGHVVGAQLGVAVDPAAEDRRHGLLVRAAPLRHQVAGDVGQHQPLEVAGEPEPAEHRERVGAGVGDPAGGVDPHEPVAHPRRVGVVAALPGRREVAVGDHLGQVGGRLQVGQLEPAGGADAEQVGVARDDRDDPPGPADRDRLDPDRDVVAPLGVALAHQATLLVRRVEHRPAADRDERADHVVDVRRGAGGGPHLGARPEALALPVGQPQHQVGEGEVRDDLPVGLDQLQPRDVVGVEVGVAAHEFGQRRHEDEPRASKVDQTGSRDPGSGWQDGRRVGGVLEAGARAGSAGPHRPPARRADGRADADARLHRSRPARPHGLPRARHLDRPWRLRRAAHRPR